MGKKTGEQTGAEDLERSAPPKVEKVRFIATTAPLIVCLRAASRQTVNVDGKIAVQRADGRRVQFRKNFYSATPEIAERMRKCKRYGRDFMEIDVLMKKLNSGSKDVAKFVSKLERGRVLARLPQIVEKTIRVPAV